MKFVREKVEECIEEAIKNYLKSDEASYPTADKQIDNIVAIVTKHGQYSIFSLLEMQLSKHGLSEKLILLRSKRKRQTVTPSIESILT